MLTGPSTVSELESLRGFHPGELAEYGVAEAEADGEFIVPLLGRSGVWYDRTYRPGQSPKYKSPQGSTPHLYNPLGLGPNSPEVWIAEGEFDTLSLIVCEAPAVGILGADSFNAAWSLLFSEANITLALDPDEAGKRAADKIAGLFKQGQCRTFPIPEPYTDLNDWLVQNRWELEKAVLEW